MKTLIPQEADQRFEVRSWTRNVRDGEGKEKARPEKVGNTASLKLIAQVVRMVGDGYAGHGKKVGRQ